MTRTFIIPALLVFLLAATSFGEANRCSICGMNIKDGVAHSFDAEHDGKHVHFCSYNCAEAFHRKYPTSAITAHTYDTHAAVPAEKAYYVVKSDKLANEFKLAMAPVVVAFSTEAAAKRERDRVKEGEIVKGFSALADKH